jgi:NADH:ubiquinone oxidoreductase subunit 6 (subunit J)
MRGSKSVVPTVTKTVRFGLFRLLGSSLFMVINIFIYIGVCVSLYLCHVCMQNLHLYFI